jgi:cytochrome b561
MADLNVSTLQYDRRTIVLQWPTAALVLSLWVLGQTIDWFPKGIARVFARSAHISLGVALVLVARISWRFGRRAVHLHLAELRRLNKIATIAHWRLYGLLIVQRRMLPMR